MLLVEANENNLYYDQRSLTHEVWVSIKGDGVDASFQNALGVAV
jgi:hypothetical protein